jgi:hypothetical protein
LKDEGAQRNKKKGVFGVGQGRHTKRHREKVGVWSLEFRHEEGNLQKEKKEEQ